MTGTGDLALLLRAEVLGRSARVEDREEAARILRELRESGATDVARLAIELSSAAAYEEQKPVNETLQELRSVWMGLRSPMDPHPLDHRFARWLDEAERHSTLLPDLAPRMKESITAWLHEYEIASSVAKSEDDPRLQQFDMWATLVGRHAAVGSALSEELTRWAALQTQRLLAIRKRGVEAALDRGDVAAARNELAAIEQLHDIPEPNVAELWEAIADLAQRQTEIESWRKELAGTPRDWTDVVRMHDVWAKGRRLAQTRGTPREWIEIIDRDLEHLQSLAGGFITSRAAECNSIEAIHRELAGMREASRGYESLPDETWLEPLASALVRVLDRDVDSASTPAVLRELARDANAVAMTMPASGGRAVQDAMRRVDAVVTAWVALETDAVIPALPNGVVPSRFAARMDAARVIADRVAAVEASMLRGDSTSARMSACRDAMAALDEILTDAPQHAQARSLMKNAVMRLEQLRLDHRIERWDVDELRASLAGTRVTDAAYASLEQTLPVLDELAALRRRTGSAHDLHALSEWWEAWRALELRLPSQQPDALCGALETVHRDIAATVHAIVRDHLLRATSIEEDRAAEIALTALVIDLPLREDLHALNERRIIHAAVNTARREGTAQLAALIRDSWRTIERYLPWADAILTEAFERAWDDADDDALEALRDVAFRENHGRVDNDRFRHWLEWLDVDRGLTLGVMPERLRRLLACVRRDAATPSIVRRLARVVDHWRAQHEDAVLVWAYRAFAVLDPPLFPGVDPLVALLRRTESEMAAIVQACQDAAIVDEAFVAEMDARLRQTQDVWTELDQLLTTVPVQQGAAWPAPPPELARTRRLLDGFTTVLQTLDRWTRSDVRPLAAEWSSLRYLLLRELAPYPAEEVFHRVLRKVEPLTRVHALERYFRDACADCAAANPKDRDPFAQAARNLDAVVDTLRAAEPEGTHTSRAVSDEYWNEIPQLAGDLLPNDAAGGLDALRRRLLVLHANHVLFREAIDVLWSRQPNVGAAGDFDPAAHAAYLALYPPVPPSSLLVRRLFDGLAARSQQRVILRRSHAHLPVWLQTYADNISKGVSPW